jgi:hypothetical protein
MRLNANRNGTLEFTRRRHAKGALLVGIALAVIASLPFLIGEGPLLPRLGTTIVIGAIASTFAAIGWPRRVRVVLEPEARTITAGRDVLRLELDAYYRLVTRDEHDDYAWPTYRIEIATPSRSVTVLEDRHPDGVLRDFALLCAAFPLDVQIGWGLSPGAPPWSASSERRDSRRSRSPATPLTRRTTDVLAQRETGWTVVLGSFAVAFLMLRAVLNRVSVGDTLLTQNIVLPIVSVVIVATIGTAVLTRSVVLHANGSVRIEYRTLGLTWKRLVLPRESVIDAHAVGAKPGRTWHLLLSTTQGPVSVPCYDGGARELTEELARRL